MTVIIIIKNHNLVCIVYVLFPMEIQINNSILLRQDCNYYVFVCTRREDHSQSKVSNFIFLCILFQFQSLYIITCLQVFQTLYINLSVQLSIYLNILVRIKIKSYFYMYSPNHIFVQRSEVTNFKIHIFMVQVLIIMKMFVIYTKHLLHRLSGVKGKKKSNGGVCIYIFYSYRQMRQMLKRRLL